jgi:hypothetical protein
LMKMIWNRRSGISHIKKATVMFLERNKAK